MGRCPPGVLCIENATILFFICILLIVALYYYYNKSLQVAQAGQAQAGQAQAGQAQAGQAQAGQAQAGQAQAGQAHVNYNVEFAQSKDIFTNPYMPPLKHNFFMPPTTGDPRGIPINVPTQGATPEYKQMGLLNRINGKETVLSLMGRPLYTNRQKWQYYTMREYNNIKLPISKNGRSCTSEYGCDELFNGDTVYVEGYKDAFKVTLYEMETPRYIPHI